MGNSHQPRSAGVCIDAWDDQHEPIDPSDPIEAIKLRMEEQTLTRKDMEAYLFDFLILRPQPVY